MWGKITKWLSSRISPVSPCTTSFFQFVLGFFTFSCFRQWIPTQWTWVWANSGRRWKTGKADTSMESQGVGHNLATGQQQQQWIYIPILHVWQAHVPAYLLSLISFIVFFIVQMCLIFREPHCLWFWFSLPYEKKKPFPMPVWYKSVMISFSTFMVLGFYT